MINEVRELLTPVADSLLITPRRSAVAEWQEFERNEPERAFAISSTTRAGMIHDFTVREVRRALSRPDAKASEARESAALGFFVVAVGDQLLVRYKYVAAGMPQNVATVAQRRLAQQRYGESMMETLTLEGVPTPPTLVTCGYTLEPDGSLGTVSVQCDYDKTCLWRYFAWGDAGEGFGSFETLPLDPLLTPDATIVRSASEESKRSDASSEE